MKILKPWQAFLIEFGPLLVFFIVSVWLKFIPATAVLVSTTLLALFVSWTKQQRIAFFPLLAALTIVIPGMITLITDNPKYIINKDTWYNGAMALAILVGLIADKLILREMFKNLFHISKQGWVIVSLLWATMFGVLGLSNYLIGTKFSQEAWLAYKMIATATTIIFALYLLIIARKHRLPGATPWGMIQAKK
ncbi:hypothetical protein FJZ22_01910 [Candidatus Pacearchaeota archaeon]|nr:hypothetical protein [Candidatus Pacearchaeota archaeon]